MKLFIGCSSSNDIPNKYMEDCKICLEELFNLEYDLVFGASNNGLMGLSYEVTINNRRSVIGIFPEIYKDEVESLDCLKIPVKTISDRTLQVIEQSDALIFLPGGIGTVYELFTAIESKRSHEFDKPIIIYNSCGYFDKLFDFMSLMYDEKFTSRKVEDCYYVCDNVNDMIDHLNNYYNKNDVLKKKKSI